VGLRERLRSARAAVADVLPRRGPDPLGEGVWRRAHDRFRRAVDRYHQVMEGVPDGPVRDALEAVGAGLAADLDAVRARCVLAQSAAPSAGLDVPGGAWRDEHRTLSRAATLVAQAAESAAMARVAVRAGDTDQALRRADAARRAAGQVRALCRPSP
jgi:hypothetical protein